MTTAIREFTSEEISAYLEMPDGYSIDEACISSITTAVSIIGKYETGDSRRDPDMIVAAVNSIIGWAGDYGVWLEKVSIEKLDGDTVELVFD